MTRAAYRHPIGVHVMTDRILRLLAPGALALALGMGSPADAFHSTFYAPLDRVEIDGNVFGAADGIADFVDEFDDDVPGPEWTTFMGASTETGGFVTFHGPGMHLPYVPNIDLSVMKHQVAPARYAGDYTITATWLPALPETDRRFHVQLIGQGDWLRVESAGISVTNLSATSAAAYWPAAMPGYAISQELTQLDSGYHAPEIVRYDAVAVNAEAVTGPIVLRLTVDDATDTLTTSFSLDGGATFQSPFTPLPLFRFGGIVDHEIVAGAAAVQAGPLPKPDVHVAMRSFEVKKTASGVRKITWHAKQWNVTFFQETPLYDIPLDVALNVAVDGVTQCFRMPSIGWTEVGYQKYKYLDRLRVHGPVERARLSAGFSGYLDIKIKVVGDANDVVLVPPNPGTQADMTMEVSGLTDYCTSSTGGRLRRNTERVFKVQSAPPPASCVVAGCGP